MRGFQTFAPSPRDGEVQPFRDQQPWRGHILETRYVRKADRAFLDEIRNAGLYERSEMLLRSCYRCGASASSETRAPTISSVLRAVTSTDAMTTDYFPFPRELPGRAASRIADEARGINRVVCEITSKPAGTIKCE